MARFDLTLMQIRYLGDDAGPIAAHKMLQPVKAQSVIKKQDEVVFGPEVDLQVGIYERELSVGLERVARFRMEYKFYKNADADKGYKLSAGHILVVAEHPYGRGRGQAAVFKQSNHDGEDAKQEHLLRQLFEKEKSEWWGFVETKHRDWWENDPSCLTAAISKPAEMSEFGDNRDSAKGARVIGVCQDYRDLFAELKQHPRIEELIKWTAKGSIRFGKHSEVRLCPNAQGERAVNLLQDAIHYGLAGPLKDGAQWVGTPVIQLIEQVYKEQLNRLNRAEMAKLKLERYASEGHDLIERLADDGSLAETQHTEADEDLQRLVARLENTYTDGARYLRAAIELCKTTGDYPTQEQIAEKMAIGLTKAKEIVKRIRAMVKELDESFISLDK